MVLAESQLGNTLPYGRGSDRSRDRKGAVVSAGK